MIRRAVLAMVLGAAAAAAGAQAIPLAATPRDARITTVVYSSAAIVPVPVRRGMVTLIVLPEDETITTPPATGKGADCARETDTWCVTAVGRDILVKPKTGATSTNLVIVTTKRRHTFDLVAQPEGSTAPAVMRLDVVLPPPVVARPLATDAPGPALLSARELVANRLAAAPLVRNAEYSVALGEHAEDLVPTMVFDDGTHTYLSFAPNRALPAVFESTPDGGEQIVNVRMHGDLLVADRVARRFVLRLGNRVAALINEAFDADGVGHPTGTTVPGVQRIVRSEAATPAGLR